MDHVISETDYFFPKTINQAVDLKCQFNDNARFIAGGTDLLLSMEKEQSKPYALIDITHISELGIININENSVSIGASVTYNQILSNKALCNKLPFLEKAIRSIGGVQVRNVATLVGNIANASPAGDTLPVLYVLKAIIHISGKNSKREVPIENFILGVRRIDLSSDELITHITFELPEPCDSCVFEKQGNRHSMAISVASLAMKISSQKEKINKISIALGSVGPTVVFIEEIPMDLINQKLTHEIIDEITKFISRKAKPIDDIRGSAKYRLLATEGLVRKSLLKFITN